MSLAIDLEASVLLADPAKLAQALDMPRLPLSTAGGRAMQCLIAMAEGRVQALAEHAREAIKHAESLTEQARDAWAEAQAANAELATARAALRAVTRAEFRRCARGSHER